MFASAKAKQKLSLRLREERERERRRKKLNKKTQMDVSGFGAVLIGLRTLMLMPTMISISLGDLFRAHGSIRAKFIYSRTPNSIL